MTLALLAAAAAILLALIPACTVQVLYLAALRLRAKETNALEWFRETLEPRLGLKLEDGALTFSMVKHSLLILLTVIVVRLAFTAEAAGWTSLAESFVLSWALMLTMAHVLPHLAYRKTSGRWLFATLPLLLALKTISRPLVATLLFLESLTELNEPKNGKEEAATQAENIEALIEAGAEEGLIEEEDRKLIQSVVEFGDKTVREVMTPRPNIVAAPSDVSFEEMKDLVAREEYSRIPIYEGSIDHVIGFVHLRDVFQQDRMPPSRRSLSAILRPIKYVPETKRISEMFREMQEAGSHMAMVADEYGNTAGLVTMEDLVEEILGEIRDEHEPDRDVIADEAGGYRVSGNLDLDRLADLLQFRPPEGTESTTVGGLVTEWLGRVPHAGESADREGLHLEVLRADDRRVSLVRVSRPEPPAESEPGAVSEEVRHEPAQE